MKFLQGISILLLVVAHAPIVSAQHQPVQIPSNVFFTSNVQVEESRDDRFKVTTTGDKSGVRYRLMHWNAEGRVEGFKGAKLESYSTDTWHIRCHSYPDPSSKHCGVYRNGITLLVYAGKLTSGEWLTATNGGLGLSAPSMIEVDGTVIYRDSKMAANAMDELSKGKKATVRVPPDLNVPVERIITFDLYGFDEAVELCRWAIKQVQ